MTANNGSQTAKVALVTGGSRGLGRALTENLVCGGWQVVIDARDHVRLTDMVANVAMSHAVTAIPGDVADPGHHMLLAEAVADAGGLDLLVNNASVLGPSPQPQLADYPLEVLEKVYAVNTVAPLALFQMLLPQLVQRGGRVVNVSSDAEVEPYPGWGGYGSAKAALDQLTAVLAVEHPQLRIYSFDPGDMATDLHQQAFPGEDISPQYGRPISYGYLTGQYPLLGFQTVYARQPTSAEMPSAGRPFTASLLVRLMALGIAIAPVVAGHGAARATGQPPAAPGSRGRR